MSYGNFVLDKGYKADNPIAKFAAVKQGADDDSVDVAGAGDLVLGFSQFDVTTDDIGNQKGASVRMMGITEAVVKTGATVNAGQQVTTDTGGVVKASAVGDHVCGVALTSVATAAAGDRISVLIYHYKDTDVS